MLACPQGKEKQNYQISKDEEEGKPDFITSVQNAFIKFVPHVFLEGVEAQSKRTKKDIIGCFAVTRRGEEA
jgi:hypothetical protein